MTDDDFLPPSANQISFSTSAGAGLSALLIGCTLLISACVLMVFNVILFRGGLGGIPHDLALIGAVIGIGSIVVLGVFALIMGIRGWSAVKPGESSTIVVGGVFASGSGLIAWLIAGINLHIILLS